MRKKIDPAIKAKAALEAIKGELTIAEIAAKYQVHPNKIDGLHKTIGEITMENDWLKKSSVS